jgi:peptidyl-prolyl cis-trans isomerase A (cyclophilin A)
MSRGPDQYKVRLQTTKGDVVILVHRDWSPLGADHFYELTKMGFYNDNYIFRALKGFIVQWGINGDPKVNKDWSVIPIRDDPPKVSNKTGTVVFAMAGPNSRTTQVFINLGDNSQSLDPQGFTPFGEVIQGMDNVQNFFMEYGEGAPNGSGPSQAAIADIGNGYLEEHFPKLDRIKKAGVVP